MTDTNEVVEYLRRMSAGFREKATRTLEAGPAYASVTLTAAANDIERGVHLDPPHIPGQLALFGPDDL